MFTYWGFVAKVLTAYLDILSLIPKTEMRDRVNRYLIFHFYIYTIACVYSNKNTCPFKKQISKSQKTENVN